MRNHITKTLLPLLLPVVLIAAGCSPPPSPAQTTAATQTTSGDAGPTAATTAGPGAENSAPPTKTASSIPAPSATPQATVTGAAPGAPGIGDPYFPGMGNGGYDVQHYTLEITVDPIGRAIDAVASLEILALQALSSFNLDFSGPDIRSVLVEGAAATVDRADGELVITPLHPIAEGSLFTVEIAYAGDPSDDSSGGVTARSSSWGWYTGGSFVAGEPTGAAGWYPVNEHPADKATYEMWISVPEPYSVAANGVLVDHDTESGMATFHWVSDDPMAPYLVTVNVARFEREEDVTESGIPIRNYFTIGVPENTRRQFDIQAEMIEFFEGVFGPYPFDAYGVVVHDLSLGFALETQTLSFFGSTFVNETVIAHELAHQWYGDSVSLSRWEDIWLNEGFATYASLLWSEETYGVFTLEREVERMYAAMAPGMPVYQVTRSELVNGLENLPYEGLEISKTRAGDALFALLEDALLREDIDAVLAEYPDSFDRDVVLELIDAMPFTNATVTAAQVDEHLDILGLGEYASGSAEYPPPGSPGPDRLFSGTVYQRGALVLHALRLAVGDPAFFEILRTFAAEYAYGNATTADFVTVAEQVSGEELSELFDAWLYQPEIPDIPEMELYREDYLP